MFSQTAEYILRVVVFLAGRAGKPAVTLEIAQATKVPQGYLSKVLQSLVKAKLITSQRGLHGGFLLARDPAVLSVFDVLEAIEPLQRIRACPLGIEGHDKQLCALHQRMDDALALVEKALRESTLSDILDEKRDVQPLCEATQKPEGKKETRPVGRRQG